MHPTVYDKLHKQSTKADIVLEKAAANEQHELHAKKSISRYMK